MSGRKRLEFTPKTKLAIFIRAGGPDKTCCEKCRVAIKGRNFEIDHCIEEWERREVREGRRPLTADDGRLLCIPCHDEKTGKKTGERAHGVRLQLKAAGAIKSEYPMPGGRKSRLKKKMDGTVVDRITGEIVR